MVEGFINTEVGVIPIDWILYSIEELTPKNKSYTIVDGPFGSNLKTIHYRKSGIPIITSGYVTDGKFFAKEYLCVDVEKFKQEKRSAVKGGDIVMAKIGERCGASAILPENHQVGILSGNALKITIDEKRFSKELISQILWRHHIKGDFEILRTTGAQPAISMANLKKYKIPLPPTKAEQTAIATTLNDADTLINQLELLLTKKQNIKTGAMQELLKPKEGWEVKTLHELADNKKELFDDGDWIEAKHITDNGIRIIQTGNIGIDCYVEKETKKYIFEESFYKLKCKLLIEGDLLICRLAEPAGRACVLPNIGENKIVTSVDVTIFRPRNEVANRVFLANLFSTSEWFSKVIERVGGTTHKRISRSSLGKISISLPKIEVQTRIAQILSDMDNEIRELGIKLEKYKMLKQGMMQSLLTGKIRLV